MKFCINCSDIVATYKYNQLEPMCEKHFNEVVQVIEDITRNKIDKSLHLIKNTKAPKKGLDVRRQW